MLNKKNIMNKCNECGTENVDNLKYCHRCGYELPKLKVEGIHNSVQKPTKKVDYRKLTGIIVGAITFLVAYFLVQQLLFKTPTLDKVMMEIASEINKSCPIILDGDTRLDNTMVLPSNVFQYNYSLINMVKRNIGY